MPWARASSLHRALECGAASNLPRLDRGVWQPAYLALAATLFIAPTVKASPEDTRFADWGTAMHLAKADPTQSCDPFVSYVAPHRERLWPGGLGRHEIAVALNCATDEIETVELRTEDERSEWKNAHGPDWVVGVCDWWAGLPTAESWIDDLKTGWQVPEVVTPQTLFYGYLKAKLDNSPTAHLSITHWPRGKDEPMRYWRQVGPLELDGFRQDLDSAWRRATGLNPEPRPGSHCKYCPSSTVCPRAGE